MKTLTISFSHPLEFEQTFSIDHAIEYALMLSGHDSAVVTKEDGTEEEMNHLNFDYTNGGEIIIRIQAPAKDAA